MRFPVLPIERDHRDCFGLWGQAMHVDIETVRVGAWDVVGLDAAAPTEQVFRRVRIESVLTQAVIAMQWLESGCGDDQVEEPTHRANRAVALVGFDTLGCFNLESYGSAVAAAVIDHRNSSSSVA